MHIVASCICHPPLRPLHCIADVLKGEPIIPTMSELPQVSQAHTFVRRGFGKAEDGDDEAAITLYAKALRSDPRCPFAHLLRGASLLRLQRYQDAVGDFTTALERKPKDVRALYNRALAYASLGDLHSTNSDIAGVLEHEPNHAKAIHLRALLRRRMRNFDGAYDDLNALLAINQQQASSAAAAAATAGTAGGGAAAAAALLRNESVTRVGHGLGTSASTGSLPTGGGVAAGRPRAGIQSRSASVVALDGPMQRLAASVSAASLGAPSRSTRPLDVSSASSSALPPTHALTGVRMSQQETASQLREFLGGASDLYSALFEQVRGLFKLAWA
jgi:tetratricopeptide (TPR) repeat protein